MAALPNVVAKLSGLVTEAHWHAWTPSELGRYVDAAFDCFGADRLMIGSDWPVCTLAASYRATMDVVWANARAAVRSGARGRPGRHCSAILESDYGLTSSWSDALCITR